MQFSVKQIQNTPLHCSHSWIFLEKNLQDCIICLNICKYFVHETRFFAIPRNSTSFRSGFPKAHKSTVVTSNQKNTSIVSRKFTENRMSKRIGFRKIWLKSVDSTVFSRMVPKDGILELYHFQKMPSRILSKF